MKKILLVFICLIVLSSCTKKNETTINKEKTFLGNITDENGDMVLLLNTDTFITSANPKYKEELVNKSKELITKYHKLLDSHHYYLDENANRIVNISILNENIDKGPIEVDEILIDALKEAKTLCKLTKGYFNFTLGEISDLYYDKFLPYESVNQDPPSNSIKSLLQGVINYNELDEYIIVDEVNNKVELKSKDNNKYKIDLGAFSKGYILEKVYATLTELNTSFLLTAGSSSIVSYVNEEEKVTWTIGVKNPNSLDSELLVFSLDNGAISTSGDYENFYFLEDGTRRHHIINPFSGYSLNYYRSNTIISSNSYVVDSLSTALINVEDENERKEIIKNIEDNYHLKIDYCFIKDGIDVIMNSGFNDLLIPAYSSKEIKNISIE